MSCQFVFRAERTAVFRSVPRVKESESGRFVPRYPTDGFVSFRSVSSHIVVRLCRGGSCCYFGSVWRSALCIREVGHVTVRFVSAVKKIRLCRFGSCLRLMFRERAAYVCLQD